MSKHRSGPVFRAGRDQHVAYSEKGPATQTAHVSNVEGSADTAILAELQEVPEASRRARCTSCLINGAVEHAGSCRAAPIPTKEGGRVCRERCKARNHGQWLCRAGG